MSKIKDTLQEEEAKGIEMAEIDINYFDPRRLKAQIRIPTKEPYAYIEATVEGTPETILDTYNEFTSLIGQSGASGGGLEPKEWNRCVDEYLSTGNLVNGTELYQQMSPSQQDFFLTIKRAFKRIK